MVTTKITCDMCGNVIKYKDSVAMRIWVKASHPYDTKLCPDTEYCVTCREKVMRFIAENTAGDDDDIERWR